jgi:hypothetical protein
VGVARPPADRAGATESLFAEILNGLRKRRGREELTFKIRVGQIFNNLAPSNRDAHQRVYARLWGPREGPAFAALQAVRGEPDDGASGDQAARGPGLFSNGRIWPKR